jgi:hypothetical protein
MRRTKVRSSSIAAVGYDAASRALEVEFHNGRIYRYHEVPASVHEQLLAAPSKGQFYNLHVRNLFAYERLDEHSEPWHPRS